MPLPPSLPFPEPTQPQDSRAEVELGYLDYYRSVLIAKLQGLSEPDLRTSRLPSGWSPLGLLKHLRYVERRWLVWGFEGQATEDPWGDQHDDRWYVAPGETLEGLTTLLGQQAAVTRAVVQRHQLSDVGQPGARWNGAGPPPLERILLHLIQETARHNGHADIVRETIDGGTAFPLLAAAEGWPETPWLKPWEPAV